MKKKYVMYVKFCDYWNEVVEKKTEETTDFNQALNAFTIYITHPECRKCTLAEFYGDKLHRIIANFTI